jgi:hypothetical protein
MRTRFILLIALIVIVAAGWTAGWFYVRSLVRENILALARNDGVADPKLTCDRLDVGGWPFYLDVTCTGLTLVSGDLTATVAGIKASVGIDDISHAVAFVTGPATLEDAFTGSRRRLGWTALEASARLTNWRIARVSVVGDAFVLDDTLGGETLLARADHAELHLVDQPGQYDAAKHLAALRLYATVTGLNAPGLAVDKGDSALEATLTGLPDDVRTYGDADVLQRVAAAGGKLSLTSFKGSDGDRNFAVTGALGLDAGMRPEGQLTITSKGLVERLGPLVPEQWKPIILGNPGPDGTYKQVLNFTNGLVFSGIVPLGAVPALK